MRKLFRQLEDRERQFLSPRVQRLIYRLQQDGGVTPNELELAVTMAAGGGELAGRQTDVREFMALLDRVVLQSARKNWEIAPILDDPASADLN
ncbi:hypothetical protein GCWU000246_01070 [Jonquetella anthropi E3_33 E1]|nr:hypothetical protein GCWU000246_01070 [Jonquetella anthropi E3_33 E1]